jgi:hypothetical protein
VIPSHPDNKAQNGNINMRKKIHHSGAITVKIATIFLQPLVPCVAPRAPPIPAWTGTQLNF